jgi:hypothetical protein
LIRASTLLLVAPEDVDGKVKPGPTIYSGLPAWGLTGRLPKSLLHNRICGARSARALNTDTVFLRDPLGRALLHFSLDRFPVSDIISALNRKF